MLPKLLYLSPQSSTFIRKDVELLSGRYRVTEHGFLLKGKALLLLMFLRQLFFLLRHVPSAKVVVVMFGGYHSFLPALMTKLLGKPCHIILGGTDCTSYPSIRYGTFRKPLQGWFTAQSYRLCTTLLPVHRSLMAQRNTYYTVDGEAQGCKAFVPGLNTPFVEIVNGYEEEKWTVGEKMPRSFITVGHFDDPDRLKLKGVDLMVELARAMPHCNFTVVGVGRSDLLSYLPNLNVKGKVDHDELQELFATHRFYMQLSISEGFPNAICEAMLSGCVPIGSDVSAIPEIIGDTGFILKKRDAWLLHELVEQLLVNSDLNRLGMDARERISVNYPISKRAAQFLDVLSEKCRLDMQH
ncbi:MAG: glycosyltransferase family 4 protein [Flavobacteriales bacterium]|nr:glycosyltransferase family 4 protein [Flavobacteriales bacterium]